MAFTGNLIKNFKIPRYYASWKFIRKIEPVGKHTVRFVLEEPRAIFLTRTLTTPIVQKKEWASAAKKARRQDKPLNRLLNVKVKHPVGTGPFILDEWKQGAYLFLKKNGHFFGKGKEIFAGTADGLARRKDTAWTVLDTSVGLLSQEVTALCVDSDNNLWVGGDGGGSQYTGTSWKRYKFPGSRVS